MIDTLCKKTGEHKMKTMTLDELQRRRREAMWKWRELRKNDDARRTRFYEQMAQEKAKAGKTLVTVELRKRRQEEIQRETGRRIAHITGK